MINKQDDDPYFRDDPGDGLRRILAYKFDLEKDFGSWKSWRTNDGRVLPNAKSNFSLVDNPFDPGSLILLSVYFDPAVAGKSFGGFGIRAPINPAVAINKQTFVEFDLYYPKSAAGKFMRFEIWSTTSGGAGVQTNAGSDGENKAQAYIRASDLDDINKLIPGWIGFYDGETWYKKAICAVTPVSAGSWEFLNIDIHTEAGTKVENAVLMIGDVRITQADPNGVPIPEVVNTKSFSEVEPVKRKYNKDNGSFIVGTIGTGTVFPDTIRGFHYEIFVDENNLKPECHRKPPQWLKDEYRNFPFKFREGDGDSEWKLPTGEYLSIRESGKPGEYKMHGHCLAWMNQSPLWMRQIIPENVSSLQWNSGGLFYTGANNAAGPFLKITKENARRVYFNHILYIMRHFMSTSVRYGSSEERGIIPFHSFDVVNVEIHESRHVAIINDNPKEWKTALRHISWLMAMTDNEFGDIRQHYLYLLFKYAHIAVPNAQMAAKYKAGFRDSCVVPEYMKFDNHDDNGSIDAFISAKPPILVYNDFDITFFSKARVACNMIRELNEVWKTDPLYDDRNLIECMGIQGHDLVDPAIVSRNQRSVALFAGLIDEGLLDCICYSEVDIKQPDTSPGGGALAPAVLNQKQADTIGYQYSLLFKMFDKYKKYIDHIIIWSQFGSSWMNSYVLFDHEQKASQAYYGLMDPDRFIKGHSYLDSYFAGEYEKLMPGYKPEI